MASSARTFEVKGVVEGFYGAAYSQREREDLLRFLGRHGYDTYFYGPKNDRRHRARWREPYDRRSLLDFRDSVTVASRVGLEFVYALSPGLDVRYADPGDFTAITAKFEALLAVGVGSFSLFLDDINPTFKHPADAAHFPSFAAAQADLCNRTLAWLRERRADARLSMCPTNYHGAPPFGDYLHELGELLEPAIDVFYTGTEVCSRTIGATEVAAFAAALRRPPLLWDNYPVNDGAMAAELHIGPSRGRAADLARHAKGFAVNPMNQAEASKVALHTYAAYFADPAGYDPEAAWPAALAAVAGTEQAAALETFAGTSLHGVVAAEAAPRLRSLAAAACAELRAGPGRRPAARSGPGEGGYGHSEGGHSAGGHNERDHNERDHSAGGAHGLGPAQTALRDYLAELDEATYELRFGLGNDALRTELLPWLEALDCWVWAAKRALEVITASLAGEDVAVPLRRLKEPLELARSHHKRSGGSELHEFVELALERHGTAATT